MKPKKVEVKHIYLPDFYLPERKTWIEISSKTPKVEDLRKYEAFAERQLENSIDFRLLLGDIPKATSDFGVLNNFVNNKLNLIRYGTILNNIKGIKAYKLVPETKGKVFYGVWDEQPELGTTLMRTNWVMSDYREVERALNEARQARF
ncbi:hypothetical protein [Bacillus solitudinis]|uniref:hypothetical protein n=1 Tax=Bacillus solitudinis TaxID=2014074 RepID=UPI000C23C761|nr:hypothetical protein [Bacillus solitudinis]